jgi:hypothetical protein
VWLESRLRRQWQLRRQDGRRGLVYEWPALPERKLRHERVYGDLLPRELRELQRVLRERSVGCEQLRGLRLKLPERAGVLRRPVRLRLKHTERRILRSAGTNVRDLLERGVRPSRILPRL